jgi:hypothetical protein
MHTRAIPQRRQNSIFIFRAIRARGGDVPLAFPSSGSDKEPSRYSRTDLRFQPKREESLSECATGTLAAA